MYGWCKTEKAFANWLQKSVRKVFNKHPARLALIQKQRYHTVNKNTGRKCYHIDCEKCGTPTPLTANGDSIECNHKNTVGGFAELDREKFKQFVANLLFVTEDELELLCKKCHAIVTYSERYDMSTEDAEIEKKVIKFTNQPAKIQIEKMVKAGLKPASTVAKRRVQLREYLKKRSYNGSKN